MFNILKHAIILMIIASCSSAIHTTDNPVGKRKGEACRKNILFLIPLSLDASIATAANNGGIDYISTVDRKIFYSGIFNYNCTVVSGTSKVEYNIFKNK